ncbi:MAG: nucleoside-triphosphatase [Bacteroidota bacterium]
MKPGPTHGVKEHVAVLSDGWLKAAVVGSLWASVEIVVGSFLHNIRMPLSGTIMSFISVMLLVAFSQVWKERWVLLRAGIICALMKSVSPSAIIIGPMIGITMEALLIELSLLLLGRNLPGYLIGGALAVSGVLIQKVIALLIAFGLNFAVIFHNLVEYASRQFSFTGLRPVHALLLLMAAYLVSGIWAASTGYILGQRAQKNNSDSAFALLHSPSRRHPLFEQSSTDTYNPLLLIAHLLSLIISLFLINRQNSLYLLVPAVYIILTLIRYRVIIRRLIRPFFWLQLILITLLASLFLNGIKEGAVFTREGIIAGLLMNLRAIVIFTAFSAISIELRNPFIRKVLYGRGFGKIYAAAGLAFGALPGILSAAPRGRELIRRPGAVITGMLIAGNELFNKFREESDELAPMIILSGGIMQGKSTFARELISLIRKEGISAGGFISDGLQVGDNRTGFDLYNIESRERTLLARIPPMPENWIRFGRFAFNPEAFDRANSEITAMLEKKTELILLDEIGPLELKNEGLTPGLEALLNEGRTVGLLVVREALADKVIKKWNLRNVTMINIRETNPEQAAGIILEKVLNQKLK